MSDWLIWSLVLFAAGLIIAVIEVVLPSAGILAIAAIGCLVGSLLCAYQVSGIAVAVMGIIEAIIVPLVVVTAFKVLPKTALGRQLILSAPADSARSRKAVSAPTSPRPADVTDLIGAEGSVVTMLRPSGTAEIGGRRISVVSSGEMIPVGAKVRVTSVDGTRIVVDELKA